MLNNWFFSFPLRVQSVFCIAPQISLLTPFRLTFILLMIFFVCVLILYLRKTTVSNSVFGYSCWIIRFLSSLYHKICIHSKSTNHYYLFVADIKCIPKGGYRKINGNDLTASSLAAKIPGILFFSSIKVTDGFTGIYNLNCPHLWKVCINSISKHLQFIWCLIS